MASNKDAAAALRERMKALRPGDAAAVAAAGSPGNGAAAQLPHAKRPKLETGTSADDDAAAATASAAAKLSSPVKRDPVSLGYVASKEALDLLADEPSVATDALKEEYMAEGGDAALADVKDELKEEDEVRCGSLRESYFMCCSVHPELCSKW